MEKSIVTLSYGCGRYNNIAKVLERVGHKVDWPNLSQIFVKPNFVSVTNQMASTHVDAVDALLCYIRKKYDKDIILIEGGAGHSRYEGFKNFGYFDLQSKYKIKFYEVGEQEKQQVYVASNRLEKINVLVDRRLIKSDFTISITRPKVHDTVIFTATLKNLLMGSLIIERVCAHRNSRRYIRRIKKKFKNVFNEYWPRLLLNMPIGLRRTKFLNRLDFFLLRNFNNGDSRAIMHQNFPVMNLNLYLLARHLKPHLSIVDGYEIMEGDGPIDGTSRKMDFALAGTDCVAVDGIAARILGIDPETVGYLYYCSKYNIGTLNSENIEIISNINIETIKQIVELHPTYNLQKQWQCTKIEEYIKVMGYDIN